MIKCSIKIIRLNSALNRRKLAEILHKNNAQRYLRTAKPPGTNPWGPCILRGIFLNQIRGRLLNAINSHITGDSVSNSLRCRSLTGSVADGHSFRILETGNSQSTSAVRTKSGIVCVLESEGELCVAVLRQVSVGGDSNDLAISSLASSSIGW